MGDSEVHGHKNQVMSLPQLSEIESENISQVELKEKLERNKIDGRQAAGNGVPSVITVGKVLKGSQTGKNRTEEDDIDIVQGEYSQLEGAHGTTPTSGDLKMGKRHASFDVLVPPGINMML